VSFYFWCNNAVGPGRICEVGPPAGGSSFFTKPLFALRAQRGADRQADAALRARAARHWLARPAARRRHVRQRTLSLNVGERSWRLKAHQDVACCCRMKRHKEEQHQQDIAVLKGWRSAGAHASPATEGGEIFSTGRSGMAVCAAFSCAQPWRLGGSGFVSKSGSIPESVKGESRLLPVAWRIWAAALSSIRPLALQQLLACPAATNQQRTLKKFAKSGRWHFWRICYYHKM